MPSLLGEEFQLAALSTFQVSAGSKDAARLASQAVERQTIEQTMERLPNGTRRLAAQLSTPIKINSLWDVLTDYTHLSDFIPNLVSSTLISRKNNRVHLKQVGSQKLMGFSFSAEVDLELVEERSKGLIEFHLIKGDFRRFEGAWKMKELPKDKGTWLLYELTVQGCIGMPVGLIEERLRDDLRTNILAVEKAASLR